MEHPKTATHKWWNTSANLNHFPKYPTIFCLFTSLPHHSSLAAKMGLGHAPGDKR